ncbi:hypothetical protein KEM52_004662, partial [Ascosphaera acerosa]
MRQTEVENDELLPADACASALRSHDAPDADDAGDADDADDRYLDDTVDLSAHVRSSGERPDARPPRDASSSPEVVVVDPPWQAGGAAGVTDGGGRDDDDDDDDDDNDFDSESDEEIRRMMREARDRARRARSATAPGHD